MRKLFLTIIFGFFILVGYSHNISVSSFKLLESDLTANTAGTTERDQNGEVAALIKVVTTQTGFTFDCGALGIVKTKQTPGEVWVYIPHGAKKITIKHPQLGVLRDYYFPISIEAARTYEMTLVSGTVQTIVNQTSNSQYLVLKVNPANAIVELNNEILPTVDGIAQKFVKLGSYEYRVQAPNYHTAAGIVTIDDPNNKTIQEINLMPAFGWIEIMDNPVSNGAQVFIDNELAGTIPMKSKNLASGEHNIKIIKPLFKSFSQTIIVKDNLTTQVTPSLAANFAEITIMVDNDAEIFVNKDLKGIGTWSGQMEAGNYLIEAKKEGYRTSTQNIEVIASPQKQTIQLVSPTPIYGEINITSTPAMADVFIDGEKVGQTPLYLTNMICKEHRIHIKHNGFEDYYATIDVRNDNSNKIDAILIDLSETTKHKNNEKIEIIFKSEITSPLNLYIDKSYVGSFRFSDTEKIKLSKGNHTFEGVFYLPGDEEPSTIVETITIVSSEQNVVFKH